jgi:phospholipase/carboxylesterase
MTGLTHSQTLAGIIALSGYLPLTTEQIIASRSPANQHLPVFLAHGQQDPIVPYPLGLMTKTALEQANQPVNWHAYPMPHNVCNEEIQEISGWLTMMTGKED